MPAESIGTLIPTAIPGYADAADIQAALRLYHYGSYSYDPNNTNPASLVTPSMAKTIYDIQQNIITLQNRPSSGGKVQPVAPASGDFSPAGIPDGYVWVDSAGTIGGQPTSATSVFTNDAPTTSLTTGLIWVDKDATSITANPFIPQALIDAKGDLIAGTANDTAGRLPVGTDGQVLTASSAATTGLAWTTGYSAPTIGSTLISSGSTVTTIAGLILTSPTITTPTFTLSTSSSTTDARLAWDTTNKKILVGNGTVASEFASSTLATNSQTGTTYTLVLTDKDKVVELSNAAAIALSIPTNASVAYPIGTQITILQTGAGQVTIGGAGVTVNGTPGLKLRAQWSSATLIKRGTDTWVAVGDLAA